MIPSSGILDDLSRTEPTSALDTPWRLFTDQVMGGVSRGSMARETIAGRIGIRMRGDVSLENHGGFVQIALDLAPGQGCVDLSAWEGIEIDVFGNDETYEVRLRTDELRESWQSYRQSFIAPPEWRVERLRFAGFAPHRTEAPLDLARVRRLGIVAIGRAFAADLAIGGVRLFGYKSPT